MNLTAAQFRKFSDLVHRQSGIHLSEGKQNLLQARLSKRLRVLGLTSVNEYFRRLEEDDREMVAFLDAVSTNHTFFFRENHSFQCLREHHLSIWCAASSSGEEPYSVAIYCLEKGFQPTILATDISTRMLAAGEKGVYESAKGKEIPPEILKKYFQKGVGSRTGFFRVKERVKRMVTFRRFNLLTDEPPAERFDVIFCRNVLIYFDRPVKELVINRLYRALRGSGYLIVGGAESLHNLRHPYRYVAPSIYLKPGDSPRT